ncbi:MAG: DUF2059 domain-containing protein [Pseudorhodobacter sp.]|nr:DUF2059 domain-containing protein [Pseudorhodobacter sp.]
MRIRLLVMAFAASLALLPAHAETPQSGPLPEVSAADAALTLSAAMQIGSVMEVMRHEGLDYGAALEAEMFPGKGGAAWRAVVALIYDASAMRRQFDAVFAASLAGHGTDLAAMQAFFGGELGQRIVTLELEARRALVDDSVEQAAGVALDDMIASDDPRLAALRRFAETNELVELNVAGALNANLAFYQGLSEGGAFGDPLDEGDMLAEVWAQEGDLRAETEAWLFAYLALAYQPLSDADLAAYQAFSETKAGHQVNAAAFAAFDQVFNKISRELGRAAARQMQGEDI